MLRTSQELQARFTCKDREQTASREESTYSSILMSQAGDCTLSGSVVLWLAQPPHGRKVLAAPLFSK